MGWPGPNSQTMADHAFLAAKDEIDFKSYDNDGNNYVSTFNSSHLQFTH